MRCRRIDRRAGYRGRRPPVLHRERRTSDPGFHPPSLRPETKTIVARDARPAGWLRYDLVVPTSLRQLAAGRAGGRAATPRRAPTPASAPATSHAREAGRAAQVGVRQTGIGRTLVTQARFVIENDPPPPSPCKKRDALLVGAAQEGERLHGFPAHVPCLVAAKLGLD